MIQRDSPIYDRRRYPTDDSTRRNSRSNQNRHRQNPTVLGYVVNVHDSVNYDINLFLDDELRKKYYNAITNNYTYEDENGNERVGITFRCRIKGIDVQPQIGKGIGKKLYNDDDGSIQSPKEKGPLSSRSQRNDKYRRVPIKHLRKTTNQVVRDSHIEIIRKIDQLNGWVLCTIHDMDMYKRLLISIYDPITRCDLSSILLEPPYSQFFTRYHNSFF